MKNLWSDKDAGAFVRRYGRRGVGRDLGLRVYTSRLLGGQPELVLHGGGNTSVKTTMTDVTGDAVDALLVKGSGRDMAAIEPGDFAALNLEPLRRLMTRPSLGDEAMINAQRGSSLDAARPDPSVEFLLHAFLPAAFIDHTHANAILALTDQVDGEALCRRVFGRRLGIVPYAMPGFALAKRALATFEDDPEVEGLVLLKHGLFTFGATAGESYGRMIEMVSLAEQRLKKGRRRVFAAAPAPGKTATVAEVAPVLRGLVGASLDRDGDGDGPGDGPGRMVLDFRVGPKIRGFVNGRELKRYANQGPVTPDHVIRTKPRPLIVPAPDAGGLETFRAGAAKALQAYVKDYRAYVRRNSGHGKAPTAEIDPLPRVILVPGLGLFGLGGSARDAAIAADIAETTVSVIAAAEAVGAYESTPESDLFDAETWPLERAKLGGVNKGRLSGHVVAVTGAGAGIGAATARAFAAEGAEVAVLDKDGRAAGGVADDVGGLGLGCDVTDGRQVRRAFDRVVRAFGGVDVVVSNAGAAWQGRIGEVPDETLRKSFELNFFAHQGVARNAVRVMRAQGIGGCLLFNASKQAVNPGRDFGPYGLPKAATLALMRQYALDYGSDGIRASAVNADRIRSGLLTGDMVAARARARGLSEEDYMSGNLLGAEVTADDVARAFVGLALSPKTTAAVITVDGGNIAAALR